VVTKVEYEDGGNLIEVIESEDTWVTEEELIVKCYAGDYKPDKKDGDAHSRLNVFSSEFNSIGGNNTQVSSRGDEVWVIKKDNSIHRFKNGKWQKMPGNAVNVGASPDGWAWVVNKKDEIYRFNVQKQDWERMPGALVQVSALSKDVAIGVNRQRTVYVWQNGTWKAQPRSAAKGLGNGAVWASIGQNDERWAIGPYQGIWRWNSNVGKWIAAPGAADTVDVYNPDRIIVTNRNNKCYRHVLVNPKTNARKWQVVPGKVAKRATVGDGVLITLGTDGYLSAILF